MPGTDLPLVFPRSDDENNAAPTAPKVGLGYTRGGDVFRVALTSYQAQYTLVVNS